MDKAANQTIGQIKQNTKEYKRYYRNLEPLLDKPKNRAYTAAVFSFLAISLFGWYGIRPTLQTILFLRKEIEENIEVNKQMEEKIVALLEAQSVYQEVSMKIPVLREAIPENPDVLPLAFQLKNLASQTDASVSALSVQTVPLLGKSATPSAVAEKDSKSTIEVPVSLTVTGGYRQVSSFLEGLLNMRRILNISTMTISPSESSGSNPGDLQLMIRVNTYYEPEKNI